MYKKKITVGILLFALGLPALADTVYIKERLTAVIRADQIPDSAVIGRVQTGTGLELLEQGDAFVKVRTTDGVEGWIANSYITRDKPAAMRILAAETRLKAAQAENNRLKKQVALMEQKLKAAEASAAAAPPVPEAAKRATESAPVEKTTPTMIVPELLWLAVSFAMLIAGFVVGVLWHRERTRRKLGGMHIRVS